MPAPLWRWRAGTCRRSRSGSTAVPSATPGRWSTGAESVALAADDVFARAVTLVRALVRRFEQRRPRAAPLPGPMPRRTTAAAFAAPYLGRALPRLGREALRRFRFRHAHWRVGYRFIDGPGVAETGVLGDGWSVLPDDGTHFYADPFPFEWQGRHHIFVEDYPHAAGKAAISVVTFDDAGLPSTPLPVLEEEHHLSYPQVFARDGQTWMLPEASASGRLTLYRATDFPSAWVADSVLIEGREISDATLLDHGGRLWLFATDRDGYGSTSDTMVIYHAETLEGPWIPHPMNPVAIDRRAARPGGAVVRLGRTADPAPAGRHPRIWRRARTGRDPPARHGNRPARRAEGHLRRRRLSLSDGSHAEPRRPPGSHRRHRCRAQVAAASGRDQQTLVGGAHRRRRIFLRQPPPRGREPRRERRLPEQRLERRADAGRIARLGEDRPPVRLPPWKAPRAARRGRWRRPAGRRSPPPPPPGRRSR